MDSGDINTEDIPHAAGPSQGIPFDDTGTETIKQIREALWDAELSSVAEAVRSAMGATTPESHTGSSTTGMATPVNNSLGGHQGDIDVDEPSNKDDGDKMLREALEEDSGTMKGRRRLGLLKRGEEGPKGT